MLWHLAAVGALVALAALTLIPAVGFPPSIPPNHGDNIWALTLGPEPLTSYFTDPPGGVYRPLGHATLWAQYHTSGLDPSAYFTFNIALWVACGCAVYALGYALGRSYLAAGVAAGLLLVDDRGMTAIVWIPERSTTIACILGVLALLLAYRLPRGGPARTAAIAGIAALLLGAALSKEYGVAFAVATATVGLVTRPDDRVPLVAVALAASIGYAAMGTLIPGETAFAATGVVAKTNGPLEICDYIGFLGHGEHLCYGDLSLVDRLLRWGWNASATLVATFLPPLFNGVGMLLLPDFLAGPLGEAETYPGFSITSLILPLFVSACAFVGLWRYPRVVLPLFVLIVTNAGLNFLLFRDRNQVVGLIGLYAAAAIGMPTVVSASLARGRAFVRRAQSSTGGRARTALVVAPLLIVVAAIGWGTSDLHDAVAGAKDNYAGRDPCPVLRNVWPPDLARELQSEMGSAASGCHLIGRR